ncbi:MAG TPA: response regulator [Lacunisphaera sp.]|nr:response regulator [Lacunisphaera sp.]
MGRILVVDDDPFVRKFLRVALERAGHIVREAAEGRAAMLDYQEWLPAGVIMDLVMPGQEGVETIMQMRRHAHRAFIIATSGLVDSRAKLYLQMAKDLGADEILEKPFTVERLMQLITARIPGGKSRPES